MKKTLEQKEKVLIGLKKARTSLDKIIIKLEQGKSDAQGQCFYVIQQNLAVIGLLKSANVSMLGGHLDRYIENAARGAKQKKDLHKMKEEIVKIVQTAQNK